MFEDLVEVANISAQQLHKSCLGENYKFPAMREIYHIYAATLGLPLPDI